VPSMHGYLRMTATKDSKKHNFAIHRIIAGAFLGPGIGMQVNHKNGNKTDNRLENLEWATQRENILHKVRVLGSGRCANHPNADLSDDQVLTVYTLMNTGSEATALALGISGSQVRNITSGRSWGPLYKILIEGEEHFEKMRASRSPQQRGALLKKSRQFLTKHQEKL
jgi:HNH endonuclease